jgi:deoxyribodipyrimidine photo-lyase
MTTTAIWWARRDLRLRDNQALQAALARADRVVPTFVLDPELLDAPDAGAKRVAFLLGGLRALDRDLRARGSRLIVRRGQPDLELDVLLEECQATAVYAEADVWPYARSRDALVAEFLPLHLVGGLTLHPPEAVLKANGTPYTVFTPYSKKWRALPVPGGDTVLPAPDHLAPPPRLSSEPIPEEPWLPSDVPFPPGEAEAQRRLLAFVHGDEAPITRYGEGRDRLDVDSTSQLSPYLRFGMLSAREAILAAHSAREAAPLQQARDSADTWLNELIWREFFMSILHHFPGVLESSHREDYRGIQWANEEGALAAWREGRTGYPVVDAAMRQLSQTGWMHNRARMIVASFLTKDLLVDWRLGEAHFMDHLVDADPASNNGGWQWVAGTGTAVAPYFRVFNPVLQAKKHDPQGEYVRRWVAELRDVPTRWIHEPWKMPVGVQREIGCVIGRDYLEPIVDHQWARQRALAAYRRARTLA